MLATRSANINIWNLSDSALGPSPGCPSARPDALTIRSRLFAGRGWPQLRKFSLFFSQQRFLYVRSRKAAQGFNLLDLLIGLTLLIVVMTMSLEQLSSVSEKARLQAASRTLLSELNRARFLSISHNLAVRFEIRASPAEYGFGPGPTLSTWKPLGRGIEVTGMPRRPIQFHSRGTAAPAGSIELTNRAGRVRIIVNLVGRTRIEENYDR